MHVITARNSELKHKETRTFCFFCKQLKKECIGNKSELNKHKV